MDETAWTRRDDPSLRFDSAALSLPTGSVGLVAELQPRSLRCAGAWVCSVPCKMFQDELGDLCRREKLHCKDLGVNKSNINHYEVEFLCDYRKTKVSRFPGLSLLQPLFSYIYLGGMSQMCRNAPRFFHLHWTCRHGEFSTGNAV